LHTFRERATTELDMQLQTLAHVLPELQTMDCIVTFSDGDSYQIADLDIRGYYEDDFEIYVAFATCLRPSAAMHEAVTSGHLKTQRVSWTSSKPSVPVGKTYLIQEIQFIFDRTENYDVYSQRA
jgi:hypothetical protein